MKQPRIGNYSWTPQQMARVNAQRQARGQEQLLNISMGDQGYSDEYNKYYEEIQKKSNKPEGITKSKYDLEKEAQSKTPISQRNSSEFREKFRKKQILPSGIGGMKGGISSPAIRQGYTVMG
jgi:hypothetical protein